MIYVIKKTNQFKQDFKLCIKRGLDINEFTNVLTLLRNGSPLPEHIENTIMIQYKV